jgi:acyl-homoserine-lactone acylase
LVWNTYLGYTLLPKAVDTAWAQNSNSVPWWMSEAALEPEDYPAYLSFAEGPSLREQRGLELLQTTKTFNLETLISVKYDHHVLLAKRVLPDLIDLATTSTNALVQEAATVLEAWDKQLGPDSEGAVLFWLWYNEVAWDDSMFAEPWDSTKRSTTLRGLAHPDEALAALERAATTLQDDVGLLAVPYGELMRLRRGEMDVPANGGDDGMGVFRALWPAPNEDGSYSPIGGDSWTFAVEFSEPLNVQVLLTYGNSSDPASVHFGDQLELSSQGKMRVPWRTKEDIEANLEKRESF